MAPLDGQHTPRIDRIAVGFDGSPAAMRALDWACEAADWYDARLVVVVASGDPEYGGFSPLVVPGREMAERWAAKARTQLAACGRGADPTVVPVEQPIVALVETADPTTLTVVGATGHRRLAGVLRDSVSQVVAGKARGPVVVVRPLADPAADRVVVGVDGSDASLAAWEFARSEAQRDGFPLVAVHARRAGRLGSRTAPPVPDRLPPGTAVVAGRPDRVLAAASARASMVVVGTRGTSLAGGLLHGSVSQRVLQHARCPVAIVRPAPAG